MFSSFIYPTWLHLAFIIDLNVGNELQKLFFFSLLIDHSSLLNLSVQTTWKFPSSLFSGGQVNWWSTCGGGGGGAGRGSCSLTLPPPLPHPSQYHLTLSLVPARDPGKLKAAENGLAVLQICSVLLWGRKILGMGIGSPQRTQTSTNPTTQGKVSKETVSFLLINYRGKKCNGHQTTTFTWISCYICIDCWKFFLVCFQAALCPW